jgi:hypothetical protein
MDTKTLKKLVEKYSVEKLEACIAQQAAKGENECLPGGGAEDEVFEDLSQAGVVRELMSEGRSLSEALRELGRRIRAVYGKEDDADRS